MGVVSTVFWALICSVSENPYLEPELPELQIPESGTGNVSGLKGSPLVNVPICLLHIMVESLCDIIQ